MPVTEQIALATPAEIARCLGRTGIFWAPGRSGDGGGSSQWLYTWVVGNHAGSSDLLHRGVLYVGVDQSAAGERVGNETGWRGGLHGHGLAIDRLGAECVGGPVTLASSTELAEAREVLWNQPLGDQWRAGIGAAFDWLHADTDPAAILRRVETLAIRLTVHLGNVGAPVNSQYKGAWDVSRTAAADADELAYWLAKHELDPAIPAQSNA